jgi:hypothetical protein
MREVAEGADESLLRYYRLRDGAPERCTLMEWADAWRTRSLRFTITPSGWVETIFEGHDPYNYYDPYSAAAPDRLFCTGAFNLRGRCVADERFETLEEALARHEQRAASSFAR